MLQLKSVLVALADLASEGSASIDEAVRISRGSGAQITLLHALPVPVMPQFGDDLAGDRARAEARCLELAARLRERGARVADTPIVRIESPAQLVMTARAEQNRDLVVLGLGNKAAIDRFLLGSTVERVLRDCPQPVWLARPPQKPQMTSILAAVDTLRPAGDAMRMGLLLARTFQARLELLRVFPESESRARSLPQQKESLLAFARGFDTDTSRRSESCSRPRCPQASGWSCCEQRLRGRRPRRLRLPCSAWKPSLTTRSRSRSSPFGLRNRIPHYNGWVGARAPV